uniref:Uncharacterized protein n=1 Tax=Arundo donax TaxID=35708 RepID=A0A0A8Y094_ARUDO
MSQGGRRLASTPGRRPTFSPTSFPTPSMVSAC